MQQSYLLDRRHRHRRNEDAHHDVYSDGEQRHEPQSINPRLSESGAVNWTRHHGRPSQRAGDSSTTATLQTRGWTDTERPIRTPSSDGHDPATGRPPRRRDLLVHAIRPKRPATTAFRTTLGTSDRNSATRSWSTLATYSKPEQQPPRYTQEVAQPARLQGTEIASTSSA